MKSLISIAASLLFSITGNSQLLNANGSIDTSQYITYNGVVPPLYNPKPSNKLDTQYIAIKLNGDFKVVSGALALTFPPVQKTPIPKADFRQQQRATGSQKIFTFRSVPISEDDFMLFRNRTLCPQSEYSINGNDITYPTAVNKDVFELILLVREK